MNLHKPCILFILCVLCLTACQPVQPSVAPTTKPPLSAPLQPAPTETLPAPAAESLSQTGPWILLSTESGLWAINSDGSGLTQLTTERILAPSDLSAGLARNNPHLAYITANDPANLQGLTLKLLTLPEGTLKTITSLTSAATEPQVNAEVCDPNYEAARAATIGNSLAWSPDGSKLAFTASIDGPTADVYVYSLQDESLTRLSDEPGQAYDLHWHGLPGSETIVYFSASCFGTGAGFEMEGVWATNLSAAKAELLYQPNPESWGEEFITWVRPGREAFFVATRSGCPYRDLRLVEIATKEIKPLIEGCFDDLAVGPTSSLAVLISSDFSQQPGLYLYPEPDIPDLPPVYVPEPNGRKVRHLSAKLFISVAAERSLEIRSFDWSGNPAWYQGSGGFPAIALDESAWVWEEKGALHLGGQGMASPVTLLEQAVNYPFWYEDVSGANFVQRLLFFSEGDQSALYLASSPDYHPTLLAEDLRPLSPPVIVLP